jgi:hypothetical protein
LAAALSRIRRRDNSEYSKEGEEKDDLFDMIELQYLK